MNDQAAEHDETEDKDGNQSLADRLDGLDVYQLDPEGDYPIDDALPETLRRYAEKEGEVGFNPKFTVEVIVRPAQDGEAAQDGAIESDGCTFRHIAYCQTLEDVAKRIEED